MAEFVVSDENKQATLAAIRKAYAGLKVDPIKGSSQLANAIGVVNSLVALGIVIPKDKQKDVLQRCYIGSNASQARQSLMPSAKAAKSAEIAEELLDMLDE